jgi:hypothetical protein
MISVMVTRSVARGNDDAGLNGQPFYCFRLGEMVPADHLVREIAAVVDLSWVHAALAPC